MAGGSIRPYEIIFPKPELSEYPIMSKDSQKRKPSIHAISHMALDPQKPRIAQSPHTSH